MDVIGDVVTHLMAEEERPKKRDEPIVEEITEPGVTKEESEDDLDDLPDLEFHVCFQSHSVGVERLSGESQRKAENGGMENCNSTYQIPYSLVNIDLERNDE